jgi:hypothetical protein
MASEDDGVSIYILHYRDQNHDDVIVAFRSFDEAKDGRLILAKANYDEWRFAVDGDDWTGTVEDAAEDWCEFTGHAEFMSIYKAPLPWAFRPHDELQSAAEVA